MGSFLFIPVESIDAASTSSWLQEFPSHGSDPGALEHGACSAGGDVQPAQLGGGGHLEHVAAHGNQTGGHWGEWVEISEISSNFLMAMFKPMRV